MAAKISKNYLLRVQKQINRKKYGKNLCCSHLDKAPGSMGSIAHVFLLVLLRCPIRLTGSILEDQYPHLPCHLFSG